MEFSIFEFGHVKGCKQVSIQNQNRIANSVDPDETAHHKHPSSGSILLATEGPVVQN